MAKAEQSQQGSMRRGWEKVGLQVPSELARQFAIARDEMPFSSVKLAGTAALALFCGLDKATREALFRWAHAQEFDPDAIKPADAHQVLMAALGNLRRTPLISTENPPKKGVPEKGAGPSQQGKGGGG